MATGEHPVSIPRRIPILETVVETVLDELRREVAPDRAAVQQIAGNAERLYWCVVSYIRRLLMDLKSQIVEHVNTVAPDHPENTVEPCDGLVRVADSLKDCLEAIRKELKTERRSLEESTAELETALEKPNAEDAYRCCGLSREIRFEIVHLTLEGEIDGKKPLFETALDLFEQAPKRLSGVEPKPPLMDKYLSNIAARAESLQELYVDLFVSDDWPGDATLDTEELLEKLDHVSEESLREATEFAESASELKSTMEVWTGRLDKALDRISALSEPLSKIDSDISGLVRKYGESFRKEG